MKMRFSIPLALVSIISNAAIAQSVGKNGANSALGIAPTTADFVKEVALSDMIEIEMSRLAQQNGTVEQKRFAEEMITDHTKTSSELKVFASSGVLKVELPTALDSASQNKVEKLRKLSGAEFALQYDSLQLSAHKDAVSLFERYAKGGENSTLRQWAASTLPTLRHHLEMAQALDKNRS